MLHSKFSTSINIEDQSITIFIEHLVNDERNFFNPTFYFDEKNKLKILGHGRKETFKYLARHIKTTINNLTQYLEDQYLHERSYKELPF